jgi:hypothetical protein
MEEFNADMFLNDSNNLEFPKDFTSIQSLTPPLQYLNQSFVCKFTVIVLQSLRFTNS